MKTAVNDITKDKLITRPSNGYSENFGKIKPNCLPDCDTLVGSMTKCRVCEWRDGRSRPSK